MVFANETLVPRLQVPCRHGRAKAVGEVAFPWVGKGSANGSDPEDPVWCEAGEDAIVDLALYSVEVSSPLSMRGSMPQWSSATAGASPTMGPGSVEPSLFLGGSPATPPSAGPASSVSNSTSVSEPSSTSCKAHAAACHFGSPKYDAQLLPVGEGASRPVDDVQGVQAAIDVGHRRRRCETTPQTLSNG